MRNLLYTASKTAFVFVKNSTSNLIFCDSFGMCLLSTKVLDPPLHKIYVHVYSLLKHMEQNIKYVE